VDSRIIRDGQEIRRRRSCDECAYRFTTFEKAEGTHPMVIKKDGRREPWDSEKIVIGISKACDKRPVSVKQTRQLAEDIERTIGALGLDEVPSKEIGEYIMKALKPIDEVAYVRFASVYKSFKDIDEFVDELSSGESTDSISKKMSPQTDNDSDFMQIALDLARKSRPSPNPRVGAVVVHDGHIVGTGHHLSPGAPHAEEVALNEAGEAARNATLFVTLEPCCHQGRRGPCTQLIRNAGIRRVVVGMRDPDIRVNGEGLRELEQFSTVTAGVLEENCRELLEGYIHHRQTGRPLVRLKAAITLDGFISTTGGESKWITGEPAREKAHRIRADHDIILVGVNTVIADDPELTVRHCSGKHPIRMVLDTHLKTPSSSRLLRTRDQSPVHICHGPDVPTDRIRQMTDSGAITHALPLDNTGKLQIRALLYQLEQDGALSVLVEGGGIVHGGFIENQLADRLALFIAPKLIGEGRKWATISAIPQISQALTLSDVTFHPLGNDLLLEARFQHQNSSR
jgi:diaminohydroxyphosphoribosylaminopyrimidine deaminase / 5-amino-6-(5-phosphoribosylamino)uracil reductase